MDPTRGNDIICLYHHYDYYTISYCDSMPILQIIISQCMLRANKGITVNVDIFVQLNFRASSPRCHFRVDIFSRICQLALFAL